mmetsp:Transcript_14476/g.15981  ORF Transcript_14476/g.15981 Transcript_14476/m.15981 type:complete len:103 (+) Transcript_14476:117-425(+)
MKNFRNPQLTVKKKEGRRKDLKEILLTKNETEINERMVGQEKEFWPRQKSLLNSGELLLTLGNLSKFARGNHGVNRSLTGEFRVKILGVTCPFNGRLPGSSH